MIFKPKLKYKRATKTEMKFFTDYSGQLCRMC